MAANGQHRGQAASAFAGKRWTVESTMNHARRSSMSVTAMFYQLTYQPVVQVWIREQKELRYPQGWFVESAHGDGDAQAAGEARRFVDCAHGVGSGAGASVLSAIE